MAARRILLIAEDDEDDAFLLSRAFHIVGVKTPIRFASNGQEVLDYFGKAGHETPRLMILDVKMPLLSGFDVLEWVRRHPNLRRLPIIMFSSSAQLADINRAYDSGANSYVVKPSDANHITEFARMIQDFWLNMHAEPSLP
jgi:CheY-like chemotaxis protein